MTYPCRRVVASRLLGLAGWVIAVAACGSSSGAPTLQRPVYDAVQRAVGIQIPGHAGPPTFAEVLAAGQQAHVRSQPPNLVTVERGARRLHAQYFAHGLFGIRGDSVGSVRPSERATWILLRWSSTDRAWDMRRPDIEALRSALQADPRCAAWLERAELHDDPGAFGFRCLGAGDTVSVVAYPACNRYLLDRCEYLKALVAFQH